MEAYSYARLLDVYLDRLRRVFDHYKLLAERHYGRSGVVDVGLPGLLDKLYEYVVGLYRGGRKHSRAVQAYYVFQELPEGVEELLAAADLYVAMLDDAYDEELDRRQRLAVIGAMTVAQAYLHLAGEGVSEALARYTTMPVFVALSQLRRDMSLVEWYYWRGSAMDFFMEAPARLQGLPGETARRLVEAGRWMRAIILVWKDLRDVEHDRETGAENPFLDGRASNAVQLVESLYQRLVRAVEGLSREYRERILEVARHYVEEEKR